MIVTSLRLAACGLALWAAGPRPAAAWNSPAPDVVLYCVPALDAPLHALTARYTAQRHVPVHMFVTSPDGVIGLITHRARADVVVADAPTLRALALTGLVIPTTLVPIGADPYVLIARADATPPTGATAAALVAAHATALPDDTTAASFDGAAILHAALPAADATRIIGEPDTRNVIAAVRQDENLIGMVNRTEAAAAGVAQIAALPVPPAAIAGGLLKNGQSANAADLLGFIAGPDGQAILRTMGLDPAS